jgi:two-component system, chemotaxis family, chemotaxis protein CheY
MSDCLIVEDSATVRKAIRRILEGLPFSIREAEDGSIALKACQASMPAVIILDWNMPVMNGIDFLRELRKLEKGNNPKVIFCTTENDIKHIREALMAGADEYIMKPFDKGIIQEKLEQVGAL